MPKSIKFLPMTLVILFFMFVPFTWSFFGKAGNFLIRPTDIIAILLILVTFVSGQIHLTKVSSGILLLFFFLIGWILLNSVVQDNTIAIIAVGKISLYLIASICVASWITQCNFFFSSKLFIGLLTALIIFVSVTKPMLLDVLRNFATYIIVSPDRAVHLFWNEMFSINLFGPLDVLIVRGVSFRNTASLGFIALALFIYAGMPRTFFMACIVYSCLLLSVLTFSRTGLFLCSFFIVLVVLSIRSVRASIAGLLFLLLMGFLGSNAIISSTFSSRLSDSFGRGDLWVEAISKIGENPIWGHGENAKLLDQRGDEVSVHNIILGMGVEYGVIAAFFAALIIFTNFLLFFYFIRGWYREKDVAMKRLYIVFSVSTMTLAVRPNLSGSTQNFYSLGEWACFALVLAGLSITMQNRYQ